MDRVILHCDCNSFFASVEAALNPAYRGVPMAVCGSEEDRHGIVLAKNELAKSYGIQTAETVYSAKKKCPSLVIAEPHYDEYLRYSKAVNEIYYRYTDLVEPFGIDESWLDLTASTKLFGSGEEIAERIRQEVREEIGVTVSIGVSFNKVFAKLGSDYKKPDAVTVISRENFRDIVYRLPAKDLLFVGRKTAEELRLLGINSIGELADTADTVMRMKFGKHGEMLLKYARGEDDSPVIGESEREDTKSVGSGHTFKRDILGIEEASVGLSHLSEDVARRLRDLGFMCRTVQLSIKDEYLRVIQRQSPIEPPSDLASEIKATALSILEREWSPTRPIRMLTVTAQNLVKADTVTEQISFFDEDKSVDRTKSRKKEETIEKIRQKFGNESILAASLLESDLGIVKKSSK